MSAPVVALALGALAVVLFGPASSWLSRASWPSRAPRAAVLLWQSIGLSGGVAIVGAGLSVAVMRFHAGFLGGVAVLWRSVVQGRPLAGMGLPDALGLTLAFDIAVVLVAVVAVSVHRIVRARARHRQLLDLVSAENRYAPGTRLLEHPLAAAYYLPGLRPRIVISAGAVRLLPREELGAVVSHERGHMQERHGLVLLPLVSTAELFRWVPYARLAPTAVATLLEMAADDFAARDHDPRRLASALVRMAGSGITPTCALAASTTAVPARVARLLDGRRSSAAVAASALGAAGLVVALPPLLLWAV